MKKSFLPVAALLALLAAACGKPDDVTSREDNLRGGKWKQISGTATTYMQALGRDTTIDYWKDVDTCFEDNSFAFGANYGGTQYFGVLKCTAGEPESQPFNWELSDADTHVKIFNAAETFEEQESVDAEILALSGNRMTLRFKIIEADASTATKDTVTLTNTYTR